MCSTAIVKNTPLSTSLEVTSIDKVTALQGVESYKFQLLIKSKKSAIAATTVTTIERLRRVSDANDDEAISSEAMDQACALMDEHMEQLRINIQLCSEMLSSNDAGSDQEEKNNEDDDDSVVSDQYINQHMEQLSWLVVNC